MPFCSWLNFSMPQKCLVNSKMAHSASNSTSGSKRILGLPAGSLTPEPICKGKYSRTKCVFFFFAALSSFWLKAPTTQLQKLNFSTAVFPFTWSCWPLVATGCKKCANILMQNAILLMQVATVNVQLQSSKRSNKNKSWKKHHAFNWKQIILIILTEDWGFDARRESIWLPVFIANSIMTLKPN